MEDVLDVYQRPYAPTRPVVCLDEASKELHDLPRGSLPVEQGQPRRQDYEYERHGVANLFLMIEPLRGWRKVRVTERRTRCDFAEQLRLLSDEDYPQAERIVLVVDNLNTHGPGSLYEAFEPEEAHRLAARFEWHYTPEHGSWLNIAECELSVLQRQCLDRPIRIRTKNQELRTIAVLRYVDPCLGLPCRARRLLPAEGRPKFISVIASGAPFPGVFNLVHQVRPL
jgi:hypothetical protein